jgi:hypothetical protein
LKTGIEILQRLSRAIRPIDGRPIYEWAKTAVTLSPPFTILGPFDVSPSRHFIEPFHSLADRRTFGTFILKPPRGGGSLISDIFHQHTQEHDPGQYMKLLQTDDVVDEYVSSRTIPLLRTTKFTRPVLPRKYSFGAGEIKLLTGYSLYMSGPSLANLQTKPVRYLDLDELWLYKKGILNEALARLGDYRRMFLAKLLAISQAGPPPGQLLEDYDWFHLYQEGENNEWEGQCLDCSKYYEPKFTGEREDGSFWGVTWKKAKLPNGDWDVRKCLDGVHYVCPHCNGVFLDGPRLKGNWNRTGRYIRHGDLFIEKRSFHWEAVIMDNIRDLAETWLHACNAANRGNYLPKLQFYQKFRAIFMDEQRLLMGRRFGRLVVSTGATDEWKDEFVRFMSVDVQEDHFWVLIVAWSKDGRARRLFYGKILGEGDVNDLALKYKLTTYLTGTKMHSNVFMDSAFFKRRVYSICCKFGFIAVAGANPDSGVFVHDLGKGRRVQRSYSSPTPGDPELGQHERTPGLPRFCKVIQFVKHTMSSRVFGLIDKDRIEHSTDLGPEMEAIYKEGMAARRRVTDYDPKGKRGKRVYFTEGKKDHPQDCWNMQCLGATLARILSDDPMEKEETETASAG